MTLSGKLHFSLRRWMNSSRNYINYIEYEKLYPPMWHMRPKRKKTSCYENHELSVYMAQLSRMSPNRHQNMETLVLNLRLFFWSFCFSLTTFWDWLLHWTFTDLSATRCEEKYLGNIHYNLCAVLSPSCSGVTVIFSSYCCHPSSQLRIKLCIFSNNSLHSHVGKSLLICRLRTLLPLVHYWLWPMSLFSMSGLVLFFS